MTPNELKTLVRYNFWANGRILTTAEPLAKTEFIQPLPFNPGWGSLRGILVHTLDTEYGWRTALQNLDDAILQESDFADVAALMVRWHEEETAWLAYITSLDEERINQKYGANVAEGPTVWQIIMHVLLHSGQHRAEAAAILTGYGRSPGELDFALFLKEETHSPPDDRPGQNKN